MFLSRRGLGKRKERKVQQQTERYQEVSEDLSALYPDTGPGTVECGECGRPTEIRRIDGYTLPADRLEIWELVCHECVADGIAEPIHTDLPQIVPLGVDFRFHVKHQPSENDRAQLTNWIHSSILTGFYANIHVQYETIADRYPDPPVTPEPLTGVQISNLPPDDVLVRIWCPESIVTVEVGSDNAMYNELREEYSVLFLDALQELGYDGELIEMLNVHRYS
jgi:hypothetical protein